jgi:thymidine kinase
MTNLFPASKRLFEIADSIEEIKTTCLFFNKKAIVNYKHKNHSIIKIGSNDIDIGSEDKYGASCWNCWHN